VGVSEGVGVGDPVGTAVGPAVGVADGTGVGDSVGDSDGTGVGDSVGDSDGTGVGTSVGDRVAPRLQHCTFVASLTQLGAFDRHTATQHKAFSIMEMSNVAVSGRLLGSIANSCPAKTLPVKCRA
jgi:hypothetical protein